MTEDDLYQDREQTKVKHNFLRFYLERFAHKIGYRRPSLTYIDCFSGPWQSQSKDLSDTSFSIAFKELYKARQDYKDRKDLRIRMFFLEKHSDAFELLKKFTSDLPKDVIAIPKKAELENAIDDIVSFVREDPSTFPFIFIDPTGWTGFGMDVITPLFKLNPVEVLIMFMSEHISRFVESDNDANTKSFIKLYGSIEYRERIRALSANTSIDEASVQVYCDVLAERGSFDFVSKAIVLHGDKDKPYFNLVYATRSTHGLEAFKEAEQKSMRIMEDARVKIRQKKQNSVGQDNLFDVTEYGSRETEFYTSLRNRHSSKAKGEVLDHLKRERRVSYDDLWVKTLLHPLTWEKDLKNWIEQWKDDGSVSVIGLESGKTAPKREENIIIEWHV